MKLFFFFLLTILSLNLIACESLEDDGLNDSLLFKDHGCLTLTADTQDFKQYSYTNLILIYLPINPS